MASFSAAMSLLCLLFLSISSPFATGTSAPASQCTLLVSSNLIGCMSYVVVGSTADKPESSCCLGLKKVLDTKAECLCEGLKSSASMGVKLNMTKAESLPAACKINAPPASACNLPNAPTPAPGAPAPVPAAAPKSGPRSKSAPAPSPSHGSSLAPISGMSFVISGALVMLFSRI